MKKALIHLFYLIGLTLVIFLFSLLIVQRIYAITVTNPTPNPFNPGSGQTTSISFSVDNTQYVTVRIVNCRTSFNNATWKYYYTNVYGGLDAVTYAKEIIKAQVARIYATAGQTYTVSWNGTSDKGGTYNLCQRGTYYFVVIPENSPQYTVYKSVQITMWNSSWLAYIRQARTWNLTYPYRATEADGPTVSRDNGQGTNCTGFVTSVIWEMGYNPYYGNFPASDIDVLTTHPDNTRGGPYMTKVGTEQQANPIYYTLVKQSNILAWKKPSSSYEHVTIATYKTSSGWYITHSSLYSYQHYGYAVWEELIPSWYATTFTPPTVYYWNFIGSGN